MKSTRVIGFLRPLCACLVALQWCVSRVSTLSDGYDGLCSAILHPWGYPCVEYTATTDDGFILGIQRIPHGRIKNLVESRPPVFLQHGLFQGGDTWFENNPDQSLGFLLADAGFDVWVGNVRGTRWSHGHVSLPKTAKEFWDWSFDELAMSDLPAMLDLIYSETKMQIYYVGHSQGTIMAFAAFTNPKVVNRLGAAALLSPIAFLANITSPFARAAVNMHLDQFAKSMGVHQLNLRSEFAVEMIDRVCASKQVNCGDLLTSITGPNCCFNDSRIPYYLQFEPHPSSTKNIEHLFQMIRKGTFARFDYGWLRNWREYGTSTPPEYDISSIPQDFPVLMAYGGLDAMADLNDITLMLGNVLCDVELLYLENYAHLDFVLSINSKHDLYEPVVKFFRAHPTYGFDSTL
ncbi:hypothetical protein KP509_01G130100 [Ceratopteris richardii]|uniref:Lipase n=1 Tax=Ceratopteris richardii TaxID=49495 RepID=A0A8T2VKY8_CERRI|nr:hypothetical protein KP509_01G130100 [Ceratopteris richardii]